MARTKNFSPELALQRMTDTFITKGYSGTSLSLLMDASGLSKQSLYDTYGNKQAMYLQAIDCFADRYTEVVAQMQRARSGRAALQLFFDQLLDNCSAPNPALSGCLVSAGLLESEEEESIQSRLVEKWQGVRDLLKQTIRQGQKDGSISATQSATALADFLMTMMSGLRVSGRVLDDRRQLKRVLQLGLQLLD